MDQFLLNEIIVNCIIFCENILLINFSKPFFGFFFSTSKMAVFISTINFANKFSTRGNTPGGVSDILYRPGQITQLFLQCFKEMMRTNFFRVSSKLKYTFKNVQSTKKYYSSTLILLLSLSLHCDNYRFQLKQSYMSKHSFALVFVLQESS